MSPNFSDSALRTPNSAFRRGKSTTCVDLTRFPFCPAPHASRLILKRHNPTFSDGWAGNQPLASYLLLPIPTGLHHSAQGWFDSQRTYPGKSPQLFSPSPIRWERAGVRASVLSVSGSQLFPKPIKRDYAGISGIKREAADFCPAYSHLIPLKLPPNPTSTRLLPLGVHALACQRSPSGRTPRAYYLFFDCQRSRAFDLKSQICAPKSFPPQPDAKDFTPNPSFVKSSPTNSQYDIIQPIYSSDHFVFQRIARAEWKKSLQISGSRKESPKSSTLVVGQKLNGKSQLILLLGRQIYAASKYLSLFTADRPCRSCGAGVMCHPSITPLDGKGRAPAYNYAKCVSTETRE